MIERVASLDGEAFVVESTIPDASPVFEGHFPGYPLMPGVLLVETMAQASGWLLLKLMDFERMPFLMGVKEAKFRSFVGPSTPVTVHAKRIHDGSGYAVTQARIEAKGKRICDAELTLRIMDFPAPELAAAMRGRGKELGLA
jgi:3-hydroxyacyl-[acyl-carrier-protein] dehydratase